MPRPKKVHSKGHLTSYKPLLSLLCPYRTHFVDKRPQKVAGERGHHLVCVCVGGNARPAPRQCDVRGKEKQSCYFKASERCLASSERVRPAHCNSSGPVQIENRESKWLASNQACSVLTRHIKACWLLYLLSQPLSYLQASASKG